MCKNILEIILVNGYQWALKFANTPTKHLGKNCHFLDHFTSSGFISAHFSVYGARYTVRAAGAFSYGHDSKTDKE